MLHTVHFLCPVNASTISHLQGVCLDALRNGASSIQIHLSSGGGDLISGFTAYHFLKSLPVPVITHNISNVESVANVIYMAGSERRANPGSRFILHPLSWGFGVAAADHSRVAEWAKSLDNDFERFVEVLNSETQRNDIDWGGMINAATILDAESAAARGMVTSIASATLADSTLNWWVTC
ncbi:ATP-dependent Clp protease proteolytic subunit [Rahnella sp. ChDrAdgB13]|uniref:ATP-dependent Clp protease proteolytic subunit n=1 Tax=Rahnella sp. ChDrAdgB13 TaxID=1850581 RepID=UPI001AD88553|nr:ATP-dependent Clp protease proteolytic subunit [Rahnella sp. ChDrAdgB13]